MNQYLIIAKDGSDEQALERRMNARPAHFEGARELKTNENFIIGGAILDDNGNMIGSMMVVQFPSDKELKEWMDREPYLKMQVWQDVEVKPFRVANV